MEDRVTEEVSEQEIAHREAAYKVENYHTVEFVAIPPDFDIMSYLSLREQAGIFKHKNVNTKHLKVIAEGVKSSPVFAMMNNTRISPVTCMYFIKVLKELGLVLKSIHNPLRESLDRFMEEVDEHKHDYVYVGGQSVKRINFTIVNIFPMMNKDIIDEAMTIAQKLQEYQTELDEKLKTIKAI